MSRIGKKPIVIPQGVEVSLLSGAVSVKGPLGTLSRSFPPLVGISVKDGFVVVSPLGNAPNTAALWGTVVAHIGNLILGVTTPFVKKLVIEGIGFKAEVKGSSLFMNLGFSHPISIPIPQGVSVKTEKNVITISGIDIEAVGKFAATIRDIKKPEPYKGKGIRYEGEVVRRKQGKKTV